MMQGVGGHAAFAGALYAFRHGYVSREPADLCFELVRRPELARNSGSARFCLHRARMSDQVTVWYDGGCPLCVREIALMNRLDRRDRIEFVNVDLEDASCPVDRQLLLRRMHAREGDGPLVDGAAAFAAMWRAIPVFRPLGLLAKNCVVLWVLERLYRGFLVVRPALQRVFVAVIGTRAGKPRSTGRFGPSTIVRHHPSGVPTRPAGWRGSGSIIRIADVCVRRSDGPRRIAGDEADGFCGKNAPSLRRIGRWFFQESAMRLSRVFLPVFVPALFLLSPAEPLTAQEAQQKQDAELRPVTHEEVWLMKRLGSPVVSPDGRRAVVSVTEPSYEEDGDVSDLWLIAVDGGQAPRRLTATPGGESGVDWRPDGAKIAFSASRGEDDAPAQVFVLDMTGPGEAVQITDLSTGVSNPRWSPDGSHIAFESRVWPDAADDEANQARKTADEEDGINVSRYEIFPIRQWDRWRDELQTRLFVQRAEADAAPTDLLFGTALVSDPGYAGVPSLGGESLHAAWTPAGDALVFSATEKLHEAAHAEVPRHLYRVPAAGGEPERVNSGDDFSCIGAQFSPAGDALYCSFEPINEHVYNHTEIARAEWSGDRLAGELDVLTEAFDRSVGGFDVGADGERLFLTAADHGRVRLFSLPAEGGAVEPLDADSAGVYGGVQAAADGVVVNWESSAVPVEVVRVNPETGQRTTLTEFNAERAEGLDRPPFRSFWFTSSKGRRIHNWLALPPGV